MISFLLYRTYNYIIIHFTQIVNTRLKMSTFYVKKAVRTFLYRLLWFSDKLLFLGNVLSDIKGNSYKYNYTDEDVLCVSVNAEVL